MIETMYLLTGAAGLLGNSISRELIRQNKSVRALVLNGDLAITRVPKEATIVSGDILDDVSLERFFSVPAKVDTIVIHCASIVTVDPDFNQKVYDVNVTGTQNIVRKCLAHNVKKLVHISSIGAIPELPLGQTIREVDHFEPEKVVGYYGKTKAEASQIVIDAVRTHGLDASIVYPTGICGPDDYAYGYFSTFIIDFIKGKIPSGIAGSFNAVDVRDLAQGIVACAAKGRKGEGYIMSNSMVSMREMFDIISAKSGCKNVNVILPIWFARMLAGAASIGSKITKKPAVLTDFAVYNLARNNSFSSEKAMRELGYQVRPFAETIADEIAWLKAEGKI
jgi:dihydroflavonol-4-reductase